MLDVIYHPINVLLFLSLYLLFFLSLSVFRLKCGSKIGGKQKFKMLKKKIKKIYNFITNRTKHKRMQQEDGDSKSGDKSNGSPRHEDEESECEIDVDEYPSDDDECGDNGA